MKQKIMENKHKQSLVAEINEHIGGEIKLMLDQEQQFYLDDDKDMLKTPPYVYVKRIERPGVSVEPVQVPITKRRSTSPQKGKRSRSRSKRKEGERVGSFDNMGG